MGLIFCGFQNRSSCPVRSSKKDSDDPKDNSCGLAVMKFMKPRSFWASMKIRKTRFHRPEIKQDQVYKNNMACKVLTLEDWIVSSPGLINKINSSGDNDLHVVRPSSSKRVHPSFDGDQIKQEFFTKSRPSFSMEISTKIKGGENGQSENSSFCRTKSGKLKKKVSFRSPEVADIFILEHSPEMCLED